MNKIRKFAPILFLVTIGSVASAGITPTGPFTGTHSETFESFSNPSGGPFFLPNPIVTIMGGFATITSTNNGMMIYNPTTSPWGLNPSGINAGVSDGSQAFGLNNRGDSITINFNSPVTAFGGYFAAAFGDSTIGLNGLVSFSFSDGSSDNFTYSDPSNLNPSPLVWDGWTFSTPISSVTISGNDLAMDGLQAIAPVPEPTTLALAGFGSVAALLMARRRRKPSPLG